MKNTFSRSMAWLHTWSGLIFGWILFAIFLTGSLSVFDREITQWMQPEISAAGVSPAEAVDHAADYLLSRHSDAASWLILPPTSRNDGMAVFWQEGLEFHHALLDPATGEKTPRQTDGGHFFVHFHFQLHAGTIGIYIVGIIGLMMLVGLLTGIVIHKRIFKDFFTFRPKSGAQRSWLDAHNALGVLTLPFLLMITFSGLAIFAFMYIPAPIHHLYGTTLEDREAFFHEMRPHMDREASGQPAPLLSLGELADRARELFGGNEVWYISVDHPGDKNALVTAGPIHENQLTLSNRRVQFDGVTGEILQEGIPLQPAAHTQRVLTGLHFAQFGGYPLHWLYFLSGVTGTLMIAAGLILFTVKRRHQLALEADVSGRFLRFAEKMNVAAVAGPVIACIVYLWANRLVPPDFADRPQWEISAFFAAWTLSLLHAMWRLPAHAWIEQLGCAALLCLGLPVLNLLTTNRHLLTAILNGNWQYASVELVIMTIGILLIYTAVRLKHRQGNNERSLRSAGLWEFAD